MVHSGSRRGFLAAGGALGAGAFVASLLPRAAWANPMGLPIGIQLYTVGKPMGEDAPGTLKQLHAIGYREVESAGLGKHTAKEFRGFLDDAGLVCPSSHLQLAGDKIDEQFEEAQTLGAHFAVSSVLRSFSPEFMKAVRAAMQSNGATPMPKMPPMTADDFKKTAAQMNDVGKKAKAAGLQYAYHNHNFEFEKMPDGSPGYDLLVKETDPELVKFEIDCGWMVVAGVRSGGVLQEVSGTVPDAAYQGLQAGGCSDDGFDGPGQAAGDGPGNGVCGVQADFCGGQSCRDRAYFC